MKRKSVLCLTVLSFLKLSAAHAVSPPRLFVTSTVKDFNLAEEASYLLQCLAANTGRDIEFTSGTESKPRILLTEDRKNLKVSVTGPNTVWTESLEKENILTQCTKIEALLAEPIPISAPEAPAIPQIRADLQEKSWLERNKTWMFVAGGLALAAGAFFLLREKNQISGYGSVRPELP